MSGRASRMLVAGALLLSAPLVVHAQLAGVQPVVEVGAQLGQNTISALQNTITAAQTVLIQANQIIDLTPVRSLTAAGGIVEDMELLCDILKQAEALQGDAQSLERQVVVLFDLEQAPRTRSALDQRLTELRQMKQQARTFAFRTQTLIKTLVRTGDHMRALFSDIEKLLGNVSGIQRAQEVAQLQNKSLAILASQAAAWQRADVIDRAAQDVIRQSMGYIQDQRMADWPRW